MKITLFATLVAANLCMQGAARADTASLVYVPQMDSSLLRTDAPSAKLLVEPLIQAVRLSGDLEPVNGNLSLIQQDGTDNSASVFQEGRGHVALVQQVGVANTAAIQQFGSNQRAIVLQQGRGNMAVISQR